MFSRIFVGILLCAALATGWPFCKNSPPSLRALIGEYIERLLPSNNSAAMISIQLADQTRFYTLDQALAALRQQVRDANNSTAVGVLAYHSMAVLSTCHDPQDFEGVNLQELIQQRLKGQFFYKDAYQKLPFDGWYQYGLALQALCVGGVQIKQYDILKAVYGQEQDGSWLYGVDETSQMLLGLLCLRDQANVMKIPKMVDKVNATIESGIAYLEASVNTPSDDVTFIGNRYSTPEALLALYEASKITEVDFSSCSAAVKTIIKPLTADDQLASVYQRLPVIRGRSVLALKDEWVCEEPGTTVEPSSLPSSTPSTSTAAGECGDYSKQDSHTYITVTLMVIGQLGANYTGPYDFEQRVDNVVNGTKLVGVMLQAKCTGDFKYETRMTAWGASVTSVNGLVARRDQREYWSLRDGATGAFYSTGASSYVPKDGDKVLFKLATW